MQANDKAQEQQLRGRLLAAEQQHGSQHPSLISPLQSLAQFYTLYQRIDEAESSWLRALAICDAMLALQSNNQQALTRQQTEKANILYALGALNLRRLRLDEADAMLKQALAIREHLEAISNKAAFPMIQKISKINVAAVLSLLVTSHQKRGQYAQAEAFALRALHIYEEVYGPDHLMLHSVLRQLEELSRQQGRLAEADTWRSRHTKRAWVAGQGRMVVDARRSEIIELEQSLRTMAGSVLAQLLQVRAQHLTRHEPLQRLYAQATAYHAQRQWAAAEEHYRALLHLYDTERTRRNASKYSYNILDLPRVAALSGLAALLAEQGDYSAAAEYYWQALLVCQDAYDAEASFEKVAFYELAAAASQQGDLDKAQHLYEKAVRACAEESGLLYSDGAATLGRLAYFYLAERQDWPQAERLFTRVLTMRNDMLGDEHPLTAVSRSMLALTWLQSGPHERAMQVLQTARPLLQQFAWSVILDTDFLRDQLRTIHSLQSRLQLAQSVEQIETDQQAKLDERRQQVEALREGRFQEAETFARQALKTRHEQEQEQSQDQGAEALPGMESLALVNILSMQEKYTEAEDLCRRIVLGCEQQYGAESSWSGLVLTNLARLYTALEKYTEAEQSYRRAFQISQQVHGTTHPTTLANQALLASSLVETGKYAEAETLSKQVLAIAEEQGIAEQEGSGLPQTNLARLNEKQGQYEEAETYYRRLLKIHEQKYGPEHLIVAGTCASLAHVCWQTQRIKEARVLYERTLAIYALKQEELQKFPSLVRHQQKVQQEYEQCLHDS